MSKSKTSSRRSRPRRRIIVLTAPSGAGKTSIARRLMSHLPELRFSASVTTRHRRDYEREGVDYHFLSVEDFWGHVEKGDLLEYEEVYPGQYYGTLRSEVERSSEASPVLLDIDVKGALTVKHIFEDDALVVFVRAPTLNELEERLRERGSETDASFSDRMKRARHELKYADRFDRVVVNDDLDRAVGETLNIVRSFLSTPETKTDGAD